MPTPDPPATLAAALAELQTQLPHIAKDSKADIPNRPPHSYAGLGNLSHELLPIMGKLGLSFSCKPTVRKGQFGMRYKLRLTGTSEVDKGFWPLPGGAPQATGSALTYYRRYILQCLTGADADDDDDGDAAAHLDTQKPQQTRTKIPGAAHERLQPRREPGDRPAERGPVPPDEDLWQDQPPGRFDETPPEERTGSIDGRQRSLIFAKFGILGITDADQQRQTLGGILGRDVSSRKGLSYRDAELVLKDLQQRVEAKEAAEAAAAQQDAAEVDAP